MREICFENVGKSFGEQQVLKNFSMCIKAGQRIALMGTSGVGKTTVLRILMGLLPIDAGTVTGNREVRFCPVFQDDRLCMQLNAVENIALLPETPKKEEITAHLAQVGLENADVKKPVRDLSDGQKRRVALVRAVMAQGDVLVLDEGFKGLDEATRKRAVCYVDKYCGGRALITVTHFEEEAAALCCERIFLNS